MFTDEFFEVYKKYELAVHKKEREANQVKRFLCNSPLYDSHIEPKQAHSPSPFAGSKIDELFHEFKDEGVCPKAKGTYHIYHRIDGRLAAVGVIDICRSYLNSAYFIYDPHFSFLKMGVVGAIRELEYMRLI